MEFVLQQLKIGDLRRLAERVGIDIRSRRREDYVSALSSRDWSADLNVLEAFVIDVFQQEVKSVDVTIYGLPKRASIRNIRQTLAENRVEDIATLFNEERDQGFQTEEGSDRGLSGAFYYASDKLIPDILRGTVSRSRRVEAVSFEVDVDNRRLKVFSNRPSHCQKFQKAFQETTGYILSVKGLYQHAADSMDRVKAFLKDLIVEDALLIALWFPETLRKRVFRITYDGHDIFSDTVILDHLSEGKAVVTGFTVLLRYEGYVFRVKIGSNEKMGYVSVKLKSSLLEPGKRLAKLLYDRYRNHLE